MLKLYSTLSPTCGTMIRKFIHTILSSSDDAADGLKLEITF